MTLTSRFKQLAKQETTETQRKQQMVKRDAKTGRFVSAKKTVKKAVSSKKTTAKKITAKKSTTTKVPVKKTVKKTTKKTK